MTHISEMKRFYLIGLLAIMGVFSLNAQVKFEDYFLTKTMRLDFYHAGDAKSEYFYLDFQRSTRSMALREDWLWK